MKKVILWIVVGLALLAMAEQSRIVVEDVPEANFGYEAPPSIEERREYGDETVDQSLKTAYPDLFTEGK